MHIRIGDTVVVTSGNSKYHGKTGRVLDIYSKTDRILVEGINIVKCHTKPRSRNAQGGIIEKEAPIHISNVMAWCDSAKKPSKIQIKRLEDGERVRVFRINGETVKDNR
jgi:large subunit ribosomal protein L24